jgi:hypothetical protein
VNRLQEVERAVISDARRWAQVELARRLQAEADACAPVCPSTGEPLGDVRLRSMELRTVSGPVELRLRHGYSRALQAWVCPARVAWGLERHQRISPELAARVVHTVTESGSYERAAALCTVWGSPISDGAIRQLTQKLGRRMSELPLPAERPIEREAPFSLVIMMDGWMARSRGKGWGASPRKQVDDRVEWHEIKSAVIYRLHQRAENRSGRGLLTEKYAVATPPGTSPMDFGAAVHAEALRRGMGRAKTVYVVMDGAVWLWDLAEDRFKDAIKTLDFHHAREHLQAVADLEHGVGTEANRGWMQRTTRDLAGGRQIRVLSQLEELLSSEQPRTVQEREDLEREVAYFRSHRDHLNYKQREREGSPRGSGAIESLGKQLQARMRGCGQFWGQHGLPPLLQLCVAVKNKDAHLLWN